jgi:GntR family transcriptional repressor for pyruvate dehydrogenase complex
LTEDARYVITIQLNDSINEALPEEGPLVIERLARETLGQQVLRRLQEYIVARGLRPGDRLPTERELAASLGVSSNTVREALKSLETIGALVRKPRHGTVLQPVDFSMLARVAQFQLLHSPGDLAELFVARRLLEVSILPLVARSATEEQFRQMDAANDQMEAEIGVDGIGLDGDVAFHQALLRAASNKFLAQFGALLQEFFRQARRRMPANEAEARRSLEDHRRIVRALREKDVAWAQQLMEEHLSHYHRRGVIPTAEPPGTALQGPTARTRTERRDP